ncbi:MAG: hypothetical protein ACREJQ_07195 [bacterium]
MKNLESWKMSAVIGALLIALAIGAYLFTRAGKSASTRGETVAESTTALSSQGTMEGGAAPAPMGSVEISKTPGGVTNAASGSSNAARPSTKTGSKTGGTAGQKAAANESPNKDPGTGGSEAVTGGGSETTDSGGAAKPAGVTTETQPAATTPPKEDWDKKVVPVLSVGDGIRIGAVLVGGPRSYVDKTKAVVALEGDWKDVIMYKALIPIYTEKVVEHLERVPFVGVIGVIDLKIT